MIRENVTEEETDAIDNSAMKNILNVYYEENARTFDSNRSQPKTKRTISQRRSNRSQDNKKKKKLVFKNPLVEIVDIPSFKLYTKRMYCVSKDYEVDRNNEKCCEDSSCFII
jgi:hypothetical protein